MQYKQDSLVDCIFSPFLQQSSISGLQYPYLFAIMKHCHELHDRGEGAKKYVVWERSSENFSGLEIYSLPLCCLSPTLNVCHYESPPLRWSGLLNNYPFENLMDIGGWFILIRTFIQVSRISFLHLFDKILSHIVKFNQ